MPNIVNYAERYERGLEQKFSEGLFSTALGTNGARFIDAKTIQIPRLTLAGYKDHGRSGGWNRQALENDWEPKTLTHDRNVEFYVDVMDVDETNQALAVANITRTFMEEHSIPEVDSYRFSKIYSEYVTEYSQTADNTALTAANVLTVWDKFMEQMDEAEVPESGRIAYVTPAVHTLLKQAQQVQRTIGVQGGSGSIKRIVRDLDNITLIKVPSSRMKTLYDFTDGFKPGVGAKQINMILLHPQAIIAPIKHRAIYLFAPGQHTTGDGYLYQNRLYMDLFLIERKVPGVKINVQA